MVFLEGNFNFATIFLGPPGGPTGMVESSLISFVKLSQNFIN